MTPVARRAGLAGARVALTLPGWIVGFSFLGVGSLARDAGHPIGAAMLSTLLIYAAPAQLILYSALASGGLVVAAALAVGFSAIRLLPMTMAIMPYLRRPGQSLLTQCLLAHPVAATVWIENMRRLPGMDPEERVPFYTGFVVVCFSLCLTMTALGFLLVGTLPRPLAAALLCLTPIYFTVAMASAARQIGDWLSIAAGLVLAPVATTLIGRDFDLIAAGLGGGSAAYLADRAFRRRRTRTAGTAA